MLKYWTLFLPFAILPYDGSHSFVFPISNNKVVRTENALSTATRSSSSGVDRTGSSSSSSSRLSVATSNPREIEATNSAIDYSYMMTLPRHPDNDDANEILTQTEEALRSMQERVLFHAAAEAAENNNDGQDSTEEGAETEIPVDIEQESVYANSYVDLGKVDTVGFDYDYTLVTYTKELLQLIYGMALKRLVEEKEYPMEMLTSGMKFDPFFSIRGESLMCLSDDYIL